MHYLSLNRITGKLKYVVSFTRVSCYFAAHEFFFQDIADLALLRRALRHVFLFPIFNQQDEACTCSDCSARSCGGSYRLGRSPWP